MTNFRIMLTPEAYKLWIIRPEILFIADTLLMDERDYIRIKQKSSRSEFDARLLVLLERFIDEGLVNLLQYENVLPVSVRREIRTSAECIINSMPIDRLANLSRHAYKEYLSYLGAKILHLRAGEPLFRETALALNVAREHYDRICKGDLFTDVNFERHVRYILARILAKWLAGELICPKIGADALHDTDEYRPFAKIIREEFTKPESDIAVLFQADYEVPLRVLFQALRLAFHTPILEKPDDLKNLKLARSEFRIIRDVFREISTFYQEIRDVPLLETYVERRVREAQNRIEAMLNKFPMRAIRAIPAVLELLLGLFSISVPAESLVSPIKRFSARHLASRLTDAFDRLCCFSIYAERNIVVFERPTLETAETIESDQWILGAPIPWYELG